MSYFGVYTRPSRRHDWRLAAVCLHADPASKQKADLLDHGYPYIEAFIQPTETLAALPPIIKKLTHTS